VGVTVHFRIKPLKRISSMNTFAKVNDQWCIKADRTDMAGKTVTVAKRNGETQQVTLGACIDVTDYGAFYALAPRPQRSTEAVGNLTGILALFDTARQHLRHPAIVLDGFRVSVAGARSAHPGSLNITSLERSEPGRYGMQRRWFGRVNLDGTFQPGRDAPANLADALRRFAADPAREAAAYGHRHEACCFCNRALTDPRSTIVGYGPICADHFGLPWGNEEHRMEAEADRAGTLRDERNKYEARSRMERA
jgi:hypothetical protein